MTYNCNFAKNNNIVRKINTSLILGSLSSRYPWIDYYLLSRSEEQSSRSDAFGSIISGPVAFTVCFADAIASPCVVLLLCTCSVDRARPAALRSERAPRPATSKPAATNVSESPRGAGRRSETGHVSANLGFQLQAIHDSDHQCEETGGDVQPHTANLVGSGLPAFSSQ